MPRVIARSLPHFETTHVHATPKVVHVNLASWKHLKFTAPPCFPVGSLPLTNRLPTTKSINTTPATSRIDHAQLRCASAGCSASGNTMPPKLDPIRVIPVASPLLASNQWAIADKATVVRKAPLMPPKIPKSSRKCQYFVHWARIRKVAT